MQSSIFILLTCATLLAFVQCVDKKNAAHYRIKQGLLSGGRSYEISSKKNTNSSFTIKNELFSIGKKLTLLENGKALYVVKHNVLHLMSTWTITEASNGTELGTIKHKFKVIGSEIVAKGSFGEYKIVGNFGNHSFNIKKDGQEVAKISKKSLHVHDTYDLTVYGDANRGLMVLFAIIVDEIREH